MSTRGKLNAGECEWGLEPLESPASKIPLPQPRVEKVTKRFWWPHPYARQAGLLWRNVVVAYRYYDAQGRELRGPSGSR